MQKKRILITGASGFIGSIAVEKALALGYDTWAGVRDSSSREFLQDERINFISLNYIDKDVLKQQLTDFTIENGKFDYILHVAGVTKALHMGDFENVNYLQTRNFVEALIETQNVPTSFIFMSTLGAFGVGDEQNYLPMQLTHQPNPNTAYGKSKLKAEMFLKNIENFPYVILRPTGVYGGRDKDYLIVMKAVKSGLNISAGTKKQLLTFIYADDLVDIVFRCIDKKIFRKEYFVADGDSYTNDQFNKIIQKAINRKHLITVKFPLWIVKTVANISEKCFALFGKTSALNSDKYNILRQRNWTCDIVPLQKDLDFKPSCRLSEGVKKTVSEYKERGWL